MTSIQNDHVVEINYTLKGDNGEVIDTSEEMGPLAFIQGKNNIIPGLESEIEGKKLGDTFNVKIEPEQAYGERNESMIQSVPKSQFGENADKVKVGDKFQVQTEEHPMVVKVIEVKENEVTLDANHPMAGLTLHFDVEIISVRDATEDELTQGYLADEITEGDCDPDGGCC
jgi:FKBP-type peptidyl-prolyl cis-trans isomerase SlyD